MLILNTWGDQAGPHMQALHFSFAAGAFVSPIISKLVFGSGEKGSVAAPLLNATLPITKAPAPESAFNLKSLKSLWAYVVIGSFLLLVSFIFFILYSRCSTAKDPSKAASGKQLVAKHHLALVFLLFLFFFAYVGAEVAYGSFIFTYAKDFAHMPEAQAAGLNSLFWGTFAATRGFAIFFATCMYPGTMILLCLLGSTFSSLLLCLFSNHKVALWVGTGVYGASMATTFPSGISWLEQYTTITAHTAAAFVVGAALGEMVLPALVGFLLGRFQNQPLLMYLSLLTSTFTSIIFPVMYKLASAPSSPGRKPHVERQTDADESEYRRALLDSGGNEEEEEEQDDEADQWNDADFEVIEMDDASPPADTGGGGAEALSSEGCSVGGDSPRHKLLLSLDREE